MKRIILLALLTFILLSACSLKSLNGPTIAQSWKFLNMTSPGVHYYDDPNSMLIDTINNGFKMAYLRFYGDQSYTMIGENISSLGQWHFDQLDSSMVLDNYHNGLPITFKLERRVTEFLKIHLVKIGNKTLHIEENTLTFEGDPHFEYFTKDLMSHESNAWRIRPNHKESPEKIRKRVMAHMDYMIAYFQLVEDEERTYFEPVYFQTCLRFYQNGIGLENENYLSEHWIACFYNRDDALQAYKLLEGGIHTMGPYPDAKTFTEGYLKATKQLKAAIEKMS